MTFFGIEWVGLNSDNERKLFLSIALIVAVLFFSTTFRIIISLVLRKSDVSTIHAKFWIRQIVSLTFAIFLIFGLLSIWFNDPTRLATAFGLLSAGVALALQQVITSIAGYLVILRGSTFSVGDRISMGGVRGDVMRVGFIQTTIMEMGEPRSVQESSPSWVKSRQFTGRIVAVTNSKIFEDPVFNYTKDFPYIWEEIHIPITYKADDAKSEIVMLEAARLHALPIDSFTEQAKTDIEDQYGIQPIDLEPRVYYRITDNWLELTVRFLVYPEGTRIVKDAMSRHILREFRSHDIGIASSTYDIVGFPQIQVYLPPSQNARDVQSTTAKPHSNSN